jgi:hypothetical protein
VTALKLKPGALRLVRSGRQSSDGQDLYEVEPRPMSVDQLKAAAVRYFKRELPKRTGRQAAMQWSMGQKALLFGGTLKMMPGGALEPPRRALLNDVWNAALAARLIERALAGDGLADSLLRDASNVFLDRETLPPKELLAYGKTKFKGKRTNQRTHGELGPRNHAIAYCIKQVLRHSRDAIKAVRNVATEAESACSIVAAAYEAATGKRLKEKSFNVIWGSLQKRYSPSMMTMARCTKRDI